MVKIRKILFVLILIIFSSLYLGANTQDERWVESEENDFNKFEFGLLFGFGLPSFNFINSFSESRVAYWYDDTFWIYTEYDLTLTYSSSIEGKAESNIAFGGFLNFFFIKNFGLQILVEGSKFNIPVQSSHSVDISASYYWGTTDSWTANPSIDDTTGKLSIMPISFNLLARFDIGKNIIGFASGGLSYYKIVIQTETEGGVGVRYYYYNSSNGLWFYWADSVLIPLYLDESYSGIGGNIGGGLTFQIQENVGIVAEIRYYLAPKKEVKWRGRAGNYKKVFFDKYSSWNFASNTISISSTEIDEFIAEQGNALIVEVDPSYFRVSVGLIFRF